jgi:hypothetical protein
VNDYCGAEPPEAVRNYLGQSCVLSKGHATSHRAMNGLQWAVTKFPLPTVEGLYQSGAQVWELDDEGFWNEVHGDGAEFGDHEFVRLLPDRLAETAAALRSCAGCRYDPTDGTDGRLQECYQHGETAAQFYIDHAISAMYHFAGVEEPKSEEKV